MIKGQKVGGEVTGSLVQYKAETYGARNTKIEYCEAITAKSSIFVFGKFYCHLKMVPKIK